jgi:hypothetical protein
MQDFDLSGLFRNSELARHWHTIASPNFMSFVAAIQQQ